MNNKEICWNITTRCNQNCKYCHRFLNIADLAYEDNCKILMNLYNSGIRRITWTGGEALLVDGIDKLLKASYDLGIKNKIITNGKLLTKERIDKLYKYIDSITLSIDSINDSVNDSLGRGIKHYDEVKDILDYIRDKKYKVKVRINSVVCKNNLDTFYDLVNFLNKYDIYSWRIFKFMPLREKAIVNKNAFDITDEEYNSVVEIIKKNSNCDSIDTRTSIDMEDKYILILANGDIVVTANGEDVKLGNAINDSLQDVIQ